MKERVHALMAKGELSLQMGCQICTVMWFILGAATRVFKMYTFNTGLEKSQDSRQLAVEPGV